MMMDDLLLSNIGLMIVSATILAHIARILKQPSIPAHVLAGIIIGPLGLGWITNTATIRTLSELGIAFLLFIVGLELDLRRLRDVGPVSAITALVSATCTIGFGFFIAHNLGFPRTESLYIGLALGFSSTMIVIKIMSDKNELETLHGRIILGILLVEDVLAIMALSILTTTDNLTTTTVVQSTLWGVGLFCIAIVISKYVIPTVFRMINKSHELMFLTALSFFFMFTKMSHEAGFSVAIGAFIAGMSIATFPYNLEVVGKVRSLRDFFAIIFFVSLGMEIYVDNFTRIIIPSLLLLTVTSLIKPLVMMTVTSFMGYGRRVSFLTGISLLQVSEFSLIIMMQGLISKQIGPEVFSIIALVAVISITITSYTIKYDNKIYRMFSEKLWFFERFSSIDKSLEQSVTEPVKKHSVIVGCHRMGYTIAKTFERMGKDFIIVDFNPENVKNLIREGMPCIYGDVGDIDVLEKLHLKKTDMVLSTVVNDEDSMLLISESKFHNRMTPVIVTAENLREALELYDYGADYVIVPRMLSGVVVSELLEKFMKEPNKLDRLRERHVQELLKVEHEETLSRFEASFVTSIEEKVHEEIEETKKHSKPIHHNKK